eukprot:TRINITY_DN11869_c0_g1_i5.p1 TRINITY_DN11869_c0_g1~~TRINITY_DN11869_c0_g1_i5.p1  ORF type:complete len:413 (-),score=122.52 TRINITY_DN11869_c0_g1_i5:35-1273(-)
MVRLNILLIVLCLVVKGSISVDNELKGLKLVHLLYRHGDRTPCGGYPTDPYSDPSNWPVGLGQLTSVGKRMHFELGEWLRRRYDGFLSSNYSEEEIYVRSTDVDRTLMSAQSNLAGLYPPSGYWKWNPDLAWQPIPVHTVPEQWDSLLSNHHKECPRLAEMREQLKDSPYMKSVYEDNKDLFDYISKHSGWNIKSVEKLDWIYDSLLIERFYNKTLPDWTKSVFPGGKFGELRNLVFVMDSFDHEMKRLQGGPFVSELVGHYDDVEGSTLVPANRKVFMYSAHDTTVSYVMNTLGIYDGLAPPYASLLMFELYEVDGLHVKISWRNDTTTPPHVLTIPGCQQLCPLKLFKQLTESVRPADWRQECKIGSGYTRLHTVVLAATAISLTMAVTLLIFTILGRWMNRDRKGYEGL